MPDRVPLKAKDLQHPKPHGAKVKGMVGEFQTERVQRERAR